MVSHRRDGKLWIKPDRSRKGTRIAHEQIVVAMDLNLPIRKRRPFVVTHSVATLLVGGIQDQIIRPLHMH